MVATLELPANGASPRLADPAGPAGFPVASPGTPGGRVRTARPDDNVIAVGARGRQDRDGRVALSQTGRQDEVVRQFGRRPYELMMYDSAVACAVELWKAGVLSDGMRLSPAVKLDPGETPSKRKRRTELKTADKVCDAAIRAVEYLDHPIDETADEMLDGFPMGCSLTEQTLRWGTGEDRDNYVFDSLAVKPAWAWSFLVDEFMKTVAIRCYTGRSWEDHDPEKFAVFTWKGQNRDPRGRSGLRAAYNPWNLKVQQYPEFGEFLRHFSDPIYWATAGPDAVVQWEADDQGVQQPVSPVAKVAEALRNLTSHTGLALPHGATAGVLAPPGEGGAYHKGFDRFDMEIFRVVLFSSRAVQEARFGSRADTETNVQLYSVACKRGRAPLQECFRRQVFRRWVRLNYGEEVARRYTPMVNFGDRDDVKADLLAAYSRAYALGFVDEAQLPALWDRLGLPPVDEAAMRARLDRIAAVTGVKKGEPVVEGDRKESGAAGSVEQDGTDSRDTTTED
jgi:hypothetical protein